MSVISDNNDNNDFGDAAMRTATMKKMTML